MKSTFTSLFFLVFIPFMYAQTSYEVLFADSFGLYGGVSSTLNSDGSLVIGTAGGSIVKLSPAGDVIWANNYLSNTDITEIRKTPDNGFLAVFDKSVIIKIDSVGNTIWSIINSGANQDVNGLVLDSDSTCVITGNTFSTRSASIFALKLNFNGDTIWTKAFTDSAYQEAKAIVSTNDGGYAITGHVFHNSIDTRIVLIRLDSNGNLLWSKTYMSSGFTMAFGLTTTSDGGFVIVGLGDNSAAGQADLQVIRTDSQGNIIWAKAYGSTYVEEGYDVLETTDQNLYVVGRMQTTQGGGGQCPPLGPCYDGFLLKLKPNGDTIWTRIYGENDYDWFYSMELPKEGGPLLIGQAERNGYSTAYIVQTDSAGKTPCSYNISGLQVNNANYSVQSNINSAPLEITPIPGLYTKKPLSIPDYRKLCEAVSINEIQSPNISIYPIPAQNHITLNLNSDDYEDYLIIDCLGQVKSRGTLNKYESTTIDISQLSPGMYFIAVKNAQYKFVKN